jgi:hypothetical protein
LVVCEPEAFTVRLELLPQNVVRFDRVANHGRLLAADPAGERSQEELKMDGFSHAASISDHRQVVPLQRDRVFGYYASGLHEQAITTSITITGTINGQPLSATGTSTSNTTTGSSNTTITFTSIPSNFPAIAYGKSWKTKHHPSFGMDEGVCSNFNSLSPSGYTFTTTITYANGAGSLITTGTRSSTGASTDNYALNITGTYTGPLGATRIVTQPATFADVPSTPGDISMVDHETITFPSGPSLALTETGTFTLNSGTTLPAGPQTLDVQVDLVSFNSGTGVLTLNTTAVFCKGSVIPTVSEVGLAIAALLLVGAGVFVMYRRRVTLV